MKLPLIWFDRMKEKEKADWMVDLAEFVSTISDPLLIVLGTLLIILKSISVSFHEASLWFLLVMGISVVPTVVYVLRGLRKGVIHDWFISERKERYKVLFVGLTSLLLLNVIFISMNAPTLLLVFAHASLILGLLLSLTTLFWKVSFHASLYTFFCVSVVSLFGWKYSWLFLLLPLVGWSRTKLKKHTWGQVVVGALISLIATGFVFRWYNYLGF